MLHRYALTSWLCYLRKSHQNLKCYANFLQAENVLKYHFNKISSKVLVLTHSSRYIHGKTANILIMSNNRRKRLLPIKKGKCIVHKCKYHSIDADLDYETRYTILLTCYDLGHVIHPISTLIDTRDIQTTESFTIHKLVILQAITW